TDRISYQGNVDTTKAGTYIVSVYVADSKDMMGQKFVTVIVEEPVGPNQAPILTVDDLTIEKGSEFNYNMLKYSATDKEDGNLSNKVTFSGNVDTNKLGNYTVTAKVTNSKGETTTKAITVSVKADIANNSPIINAVDTYTMSPGDKFDVEMLGATAHDKEDGDLTYKINLTGDVKDEIGTYKVTLSVTNSKGLTTTKDVTVKVIKRNEAPVINVADTYKLKVGDKFEYSMLNATATDDYDGNLTDRISYQGNVDTTKAGTYRVSVYVVDSKDMIGQKFVTVVVE
ncbi:MAG: immunoglobulin-like domain-containing protein, partial [Paraclostridium sp.]